MQLTWQRNEHPHHITAADERGMLIDEQWHTRSLLISYETLITDWSVTQPDELSLDSLQPLLEPAPEVLLLGTGHAQVFPELSMLRTLLERDIGVEVMDTQAACRTFNVLLGEERRVAAALIWQD